MVPFINNHVHVVMLLDGKAGASRLMQFQLSRFKRPLSLVYFNQLALTPNVWVTHENVVDRWKCSLDDVYTSHWTNCFSFILLVSDKNWRRLSVFYWRVSIMPVILCTLVFTFYVYIRLHLMHIVSLQTFWRKTPHHKI
jgi:hypothetical protein